MLAAEISRHLHAIRGGAIAADSDKAQKIMALAFRQDPLSSIRILDGVGEAHLRKSMAAAGMGKTAMDRTLSSAVVLDPNAIDDPFLSPRPPRTGQQIEAQRLRRAAADPKDDIRSPIEDRALDYMDDMLQGPKPFGLL